MAYLCGLCPKYFDTHQQMRRHRSIRHKHQFDSTLHGFYINLGDHDEEEEDEEEEDEADQEGEQGKEFIRTEPCQLSSASLLVRVHEYQEKMLAAYSAKDDSNRLEHSTSNHQQDSHRENKTSATVNCLPSNTMEPSIPTVKSNVVAEDERLGRLRSRLTILERILCELSNEVFIFGHVDNKSTDNPLDDVIEKLNDSATLLGSSSSQPLKSTPKLDGSNIEGDVVIETIDKDKSVNSNCKHVDNSLLLKGRDTNGTTRLRDWSTLCQMIKSITRQTILNELESSSMNSSGINRASKEVVPHQLINNIGTTSYIEGKAPLDTSVQSNDVESTLKDTDGGQPILFKSDEIETTKKNEGDIVKPAAPVGYNLPLLDNLKSQGCLVQSFICEGKRAMSEKFSGGPTNNDVPDSTRSLKEFSQADVVLVGTGPNQSNDRKLNSKHDSKLLSPLNSDCLVEGLLASSSIICASDLVYSAIEDGGDKSMANSLKLERVGSAAAPNSVDGDDSGKQSSLKEAIEDKVVDGLNGESLCLGKIAEPTSSACSGAVTASSDTDIIATRRHQLEEDKEPGKPIEGEIDNDNLFQGSSELLSSGGGGGSGSVSLATPAHTSTTHIAEVDSSQPLASSLCDSSFAVQQTHPEQTEASSSSLPDNNVVGYSSTIYGSGSNTCLDKTRGYNVSGTQQSYKQQQPDKRRQIEVPIVCSSVVGGRLVVGEEAEIAKVESTSVDETKREIGYDYDELNGIAEPNRESTSNNVQVSTEKSESTKGTSMFEAPLNACNSGSSLVDCCLAEQRAANGLLNQMSSSIEAATPISESDPSKPHSADIVALANIEQHPKHILLKDKPDLADGILEETLDAQLECNPSGGGDINNVSISQTILAHSKLDGVEKHRMNEQKGSEQERNSIVVSEKSELNSSSKFNSSDEEESCIFKSEFVILPKETKGSVIGQKADSNQIGNTTSTNANTLTPPIYKMVDSDKGLDSRNQHNTSCAFGDEAPIVILTNDNNDEDEVQFAKTNKNATVPVPEDSNRPLLKQLGEKSMVSGACMLQTNGPLTSDEQSSLVRPTAISGQDHQWSNLKTNFKLKSILKRGNRTQESEGADQWTESNNTSASGRDRTLRGGGVEQVGRTSEVPTVPNSRQSQGRFVQTNRQASLVSADWPQAPVTRRRALVRFSEINSVLELSPTRTASCVESDYEDDAKTVEG